VVLVEKRHQKAETDEHHDWKKKEISKKVLFWEKDRDCALENDRTHR
jgi:hypothetical protein